MVVTTLIDVDCLSSGFIVFPCVIIEVGRHVEEG